MHETHIIGVRHETYIVQCGKVSQYIRCLSKYENIKLKSSILPTLHCDSKIQHSNACINCSNTKRTMQCNIPIQTEKLSNNLQETIRYSRKTSSDPWVQNSKPCFPMKSTIKSLIVVSTPRAPNWTRMNDLVGR